MPRRIVIHMGFHKTGTSTTQQVLRANREILKPHMRSLLRWSLTDVVHAARGYSTWRDPITLLKFTHRFDRVLTDLPGMPKRALCISAEELSGHLPGRGDLADYSAAPVLAAEMATTAARQFPNAELSFYLTTRNSADWIKSAYWQHVKSSSLASDFDAFLTKYPDAADLDAIVDQIAQSVACPVHRCYLDDVADTPLGPAGPLLALCGIQPDLIERVTPAPSLNVRYPDDVLHQLLAANRDISDRKTRNTAKAAILKAAEEKSK